MIVCTTIQFKCDRCEKKANKLQGDTYVQDFYYERPKGWVYRARPEAVKKKRGWQKKPYYEHVCKKCLEAGK